AVELLAEAVQLREEPPPVLEALRSDPPQPNDVQARPERRAVDLPGVVVRLRSGNERPERGIGGAEEAGIVGIGPASLLRRRGAAGQVEVEDGAGRLLRGGGGVGAQVARLGRHGDAAERVPADLEEAPAGQAVAVPLFLSVYRQHPVPSAKRPATHGPGWRTT